jgi:hypothetical protein
MNDGIGRRAGRRKPWLDNFIWKSILRLARLRRNGWAMQLLVIANMLVLSDDRAVSRTVTPAGILSFYIK